MFHHVCLFRLRAPLDDARLGQLNEYAERCRTLFPDLVAAYRFERNRSRKSAADYPLVLYSEFTDEALYPGYVASAFHDELVAFLQPIVEETLIADVVI
jgi:hypothetical protein